MSCLLNVQKIQIGSKNTKNYKRKLTETFHENNVSFTSTEYRPSTVTQITGNNSIFKTLDTQNSTYRYQIP